MALVKILTPGKIREPWLGMAIAEYCKRLHGRLEVEIVIAKHSGQLTLLASREKRVLALDPTGELLDSPAFSERIWSELEAGGARLSLIIGGPDGLPDAIRKSAPLISLSPLTFTHQMTRLILLEQLYRAVEIRRGSQYHKI